MAVGGREVSLPEDFQPAGSRKIQTRRGVDVYYHAQRPKRARLHHERFGNTPQIWRDSGRNIRGLRQGKRHGSGVEIPARHRFANFFQGVFCSRFQRVGYFVGHSDLIVALHKIRDSYNVNGLGQVAALATLGDLPHYRKNFKRIIATRERLSAELARLGFETLPSQTNFILTKPPKFAAEKWLGVLRRKKILVRWFDYPETRAFLRITIGSESETAVLLRAAAAILRKS